MGSSCAGAWWALWTQPLLLQGRVCLLPLQVEGLLPTPAHACPLQSTSYLWGKEWRGSGPAQPSLRSRGAALCLAPFLVSPLTTKKLAEWTFERMWAVPPHTLCPEIQAQCGLTWHLLFKTVSQSALYLHYF